MGHIIVRTLKNGRVAYYAQYVEITGRRTSKATKAKTHEAAQKWLDRAEARVAAGQPGDPRPRRIDAPAVPKLTVRHLAETYCGWTANKATRFLTGAGGEDAGGKNAARARKYRAQFWSVLSTHVLPRIGDLELAAVDRPTLVRMVDDLKVAGVGPRTIEKAARHLSKLWNFAFDRGHVSGANPAQRLETPDYHSKNDAYRDDEVARLLSTAAETGSDLYPIIACAFYSGMRKGELAALQRGDVDLYSGRIDVSRSWTTNERKSGQPVTVHVHVLLGSILRAHFTAQGDRPADALVFPDANGRMRDPYDLWGLDELIKLANVRRFLRPWHSFRHAFGTSLAANGAGLAEIRDALGQSSLQMASLYAKTAAAQVRDRVRALPALGPSVPPTPAPAPPVTPIHKGRQQQHTGDIRSGSEADENELSLVSPQGFEPWTNGLKGV